VLSAIKATVDGRLRLYPNPTAQKLREKLAKLHRCSPENIVIGNGSDELLALATRAFAEPAAKSQRQSERARSAIQFFTPSYSLYPVLAAIHGAQARPVPLGDRFALPSAAELRRGKRWDFQAELTLITTPNAPSGCGYATDELETLCRAQRGVVVLDEAYVDFADENALELALRLANVLVARTFSKAYSLCFLRVGYFVGHPALIEAIDKIRDSYNVNGLGQIGALATLGDLPYYRANFRKVIATRERLTRELTELGFEVCPSQTNFLFARPPRFPAEQWLDKFRAKKILVRWFRSPEEKDYLRISIGTDQEAAALVKTAQGILSGSPGGDC
jgi:histidinol-phosphate aminotransferase